MSLILLWVLYRLDAPTILYIIWVLLFFYQIAINRKEKVDDGTN